jgi:HEPN domain-containing protein
VKPDLKEYLAAWMLKAEHDIISAQRLLEIEPMILDSACFHCQQAVEKSLKAFLYYNGVDVEKTHDVIYLLRECLKFDTTFKAIDPLNINDFAVKGRYPDASVMPEVAEAKRYYQLAKQVYALVKERLVFSE